MKKIILGSAKTKLADKMVECIISSTNQVLVCAVPTNIQFDTFIVWLQEKAIVGFNLTTNSVLVEKSSILAIYTC